MGLPGDSGKTSLWSHGHTIGPLQPYGSTSDSAHPKTYNNTINITHTAVIAHIMPQKSTCK